MPMRAVVSAQLREYLRSNQDGLVSLLKSLVGIPTINPPGQCYGQMVKVLQNRCRQLGMKVKVHRVPDGLVRDVAGVGPEFPRYNLIARWDVGAPRTVHFNAHYDVVPAAGSWKLGGPFTPVERNGEVYGRGTGDMKGSIAALLMAVEALRHNRLSPAFNVEYSFTADEETGGELGAGFIVRRGLIDADYAVVCEGAAGSRIGCGHNGVLWLVVELEGKSAHASSPRKGINAFEAMAAMVSHLQGYKRELLARGSRYRDFDGKECRPTINIGGAFGGGDGDKVNTVPGRSWFSIDRRILPNEDLHYVERELRDVLGRAAQKHAKVKVEIRAPLRIAPCVVDPRHVLPRTFALAAQSVRRRPAEFGTTRGFTDLHYFVEEGGLPGIGYGVKGEQGHAADERVAVRDVLQTGRTYAEFMVKGIQV